MLCTARGMRLALSPLLATDKVIRRSRPGSCSGVESQATDEDRWYGSAEDRDDTFETETSDPPDSAPVKANHAM
jgi:hypothetical protein